MLDTILSVLGVAGSGGILGIGGAVLQQGIGWFKRKAEISQEKDVIVLNHQNGLELRALDKEIELAKYQNGLAQTQASHELEVQALKVYGESLKHDMAQLDTQGNWLLIVAEFIRKLFRPALTTFLMVLVWLFYQDAPELMRKEIIKSVLFLASMAVTWWFADRSLKHSSGGR